METNVLRAPLGYGATAIAERDGVRWIVADHEVSEEDVANWVEFYVLGDRLTEMSDHGTGTPAEERYLELYGWVAEHLNVNR